MTVKSSGRAYYATDSGAFRKVLGHYATGVAAITSTGADGRPVGMAVSSFTSVSLDPPLVAFFPSRKSSTWPVIRESGRFCVNVLGADQQQICQKLAAKGSDKFVGVDWEPDALGSPAIADSVAWITCDIAGVHDGGDHEIVLGRVQYLDVTESPAPLVFFGGGYGEFRALGQK